ncbi:MAG: DMT family transporter [Pseudomonadota bacterium]
MAFSGVSRSGVASLAIFISATVWGLYWVPLRLFEANGVDGAWSVALLNTPPLFLLLPLLLFQWSANHGHLRNAIIVGFLGGAGLALYASGLVFSSVVRATLLFYLTPVWATLIGLVWLGEDVRWQRWAAIAIGLLGMFLLLSSGSGASKPLNIGDIFGILSGVFWAGAAATIKKFPETPLSGMTFFQFLFTAFVAIICSAVAGPFILPEPGPLISSLPIAALASIGLILPTVWIIFWAQKILFPGRAGLLMMSEVLVAVISASIFLPEERMSMIEWGGAILIIGACLLEVLSTPTIGEAPETPA